VKAGDAQTMQVGRGQTAQKLHAVLRGNSSEVRRDTWPRWASTIDFRCCGFGDEDIEDAARRTDDQLTTDLGADTHEAVWSASWHEQHIPRAEI
jgi:hypothetical protein